MAIRPPNSAITGRAEPAALAGESGEVSFDKLSIGRLMLITLGVAVGLAFFAPAPSAFDPRSLASWRFLLSAVLLGATLAGALFALARLRGGHRLGMISWCVLSQGLGILLLLPPAAAVRLARPDASTEATAASCLLYVLPLQSLWMLLAAGIGGNLRHAPWRSAAPWSERYGVCLAVLWTPLALWILGEIYQAALGW